MEVTSRKVETVDVQLGAGRVLRLALLRDGEGQPEELRISEGWVDGGGDPLRRVGPIPGRALGELRKALQALEGAPEGER